MVLPRADVCGSGPDRTRRRLTPLETPRSASWTDQPLYAGRERWQTGGMTSRESLIPAERIEHSIHFLHGEKVMLDSDLASLYGVETRALVQAVERNRSRFPGDFMFQLTPEENAVLRSQFVILETGRGKHRKYLPYVFTEQGVAMLSSVL